MRRLGLAAGALLASSATLVCCVLPAVLVALGAGAVLAGLVTAVPQLVWLSEHKALVFGGAAALLAVSGIALSYGRNLPCPTDPGVARPVLRGCSATRGDITPPFKVRRITLTAAPSCSTLHAVQQRHTFRKKGPQSHRSKGFFL